MGELETLILTDEEVGKLLSMSEVMKAVEQAFVEKSLGRAQNPPKLYLFYHKYNGDLRVMPSYLENYDISSVKIVNSHPENRVRYNLPTVMAIVTLIDPRSGFPLAIMGGKTLTDIRTGAAGGVAAKYLARRDSKILGLVGAGAQARTQLVALLEVYGGFDEVRVWGLYGTAEDIWAEIGEIIAGLKKGRENPDEITIFSSTGLAVQDAVAAKIAYDKALEKGIGRFIKIV